GNIPQRLRDKEVYLLDLTGLVAGTQFRGQFESRVKGLVDDVKKAGNVLLFIDEVHTLVGAGDSEGSMNAANILKPALSRGEIQVIGATTFNEYRKHIEKDAALERRFQTVKVGEPTIAEATEVLLGIKKYYESYHRVTVSDEMARRAVILAERYINDRFLPDKAIDLLDEACSCASLENKALEQYDDLYRRKTQLDGEISAMETTRGEVDYARLATKKSEAAQLQQQVESLAATALNTPVTEENFARVIELWTGIPASKIKEAETVKVAHLEEKLAKRIIGQTEAISLVSAAVRRSRIRLDAKKRPASFILVGSTGVGKTQLVKVLSEELFDNVEPLIRLDMSEFMEKHSVSRIIGSPPGYVGYDEAGQLTEKVRRRPYSIVLLDEIEKAHPDVMNILLQIMDEGHITDAQGRNISFENVILMMTSNAGSENRDGAMGFNRQPQQVAKTKAMDGLKKFLRPEFLA
ncbi:MAG: ATP-dependent Clp protease ATP-binding subunit, partial [Angelakisella sp.]